MGTGVNAVLAADDELCALRYPGTHELHLLSREIPALPRTSPPPASHGLRLGAGTRPGLTAART